MCFTLTTDCVATSCVLMMPSLRPIPSKGCQGRGGSDACGGPLAVTLLIGKEKFLGL